MVGHHTSVGAHTFVAPHAAILGNSRVGEYCVVGANAVVRDAIKIGDDCVIASGAMVVEDLDDHGVVIQEPSTVVPMASESLGDMMLRSRR